MDSQTAIATHQLTKRYRQQIAVDAVDLSIPTGTIYGFLGPNGAGKSTTMKLLLGLTRPSLGEIYVLGRRLTPASLPELLSQVGSLIEAPPGYGHLTGMENLQIVARLLGLPNPDFDRTLALVKLTKSRNKLVRHYSLGMKQRLGIAMALIRQPKLLILDEPMNGLDPAGIEEIRELLVQLAGEGVTVMISSHLLDEVDRIADRFGILSAGRLLFQGSRAELLDRSLPDVVIETPDFEQALAMNPGATRDRQGLRLTGLDAPTTAKVVHDLAVAGVPIYGVERVERTLEQVFMALTKSGELA
jgi:lantibiotic transport system ATP-binding protein